MDAVGVYIAVLRKGRGYTQPELADKLEVSERALRDWEAGRHDPKISELAKLLDLISGSWFHVAHLMREGATVPEGRNLAQAQLQGAELTDEQRSLILNLDPDSRALVFEVAARMKQAQGSDPK